MGSELIEIKDPEQLQCAFFHLGFFFPEKRQAQDALNFTVAHLVVHGDLNILQHSEVLKEPDILKGSGNSHMHKLIRLFVGNDPLLKLVFAGALAILTGKNIENRCFACTIGADKADQFAFLKPQRKVLQSVETRKVDGQMPGFQEGARRVFVRVDSLMIRNR